MTVFESDAPLAWGALDVPLFGIAKDWQGRPLASPAGFALAMDRHRLWFAATHREPADLHPRSRPGKFQAELWKHDVAELFLTDPAGRRYFEFNLSPNGSWWSCGFSAARVREDAEDIAMPEVATFAELAPDGGWVAAMAIPLDILRARIGFGPGCSGNVTFILGNPSPRHLSATDLGDGEQDFHRPDRFRKLSFARLPSQ